MRLVRIIAVFGLVSFLAAGGCQTGGFTAEDRGSIERASDSWFGAASAAKSDIIASHYTDDAVLMPPGTEAVVGKKNIEAFFKAMPRLLNLKYAGREIVGCGDCAYATGRFSCDIAVPGAPAPVADRGKYIEIWRRQGDGSWRITRDIYNSDIAH